MSQISTTRFRRPSIRGMLALGGAAAMVTGVVAGTDTLAATTDSATAAVSQIASENFFPAPLPTGDPTCSESGSAGFRSAKVSWPSAGAGYGYRLILWEENGTTVVRGPWYQNETSWTFSLNYDLGPWKDTPYPLTVETVNLASGTTDATRHYSTGRLRITVGGNGQRNATCKGGAGRTENASWDNAAAWNPAAPVTLEGRTRTGKVIDSEPLESTKPSTPSSTPSATPSEKPVEDEAPTSSTTTPPPSTSETPKPSETSTPAPEAKVTFAVGAGGGERGLTVFLDGEESCDFTLEEGFTPSISGNTLVIQNGDVVKNVDPKTCALS